MRSRSSPCSPAITARAAPKARHPEFARLSPSDQHLVHALAGILRVAIGLDRSHARKVQEVHVTRSKGRVVLEIVPAAGADVDLECYSADQRKDLLVEVLGCPVEVEVAPAGAAVGVAATLGGHSGLDGP